MKIIKHVALKKIETALIIISVFVAFVLLWLTTILKAALGIRLQRQVVNLGTNPRNYQ